MDTDESGVDTRRPQCPASWPDGRQCRFILEGEPGNWSCPGHGRVAP